MDSFFVPPVIFVEPPENDSHDRLEQDLDIAAFQAFNTGDSLADHMYSLPTHSSQSDIFNREFTYPNPQRPRLETNIFSHYRSQPGSPNTPTSDVFLDDPSDYPEFDCPSPGAMTDSSYTENSPLPTTPLSLSLSGFHLQEAIPGPRLRSQSDLGPSLTIDPSNIFGPRSRSASFVGSCEPPEALDGRIAPFLEARFEYAPQLDNQFDNQFLTAPYQQSQPTRTIRHRSLNSEPSICVSVPSPPTTEQETPSPIRTLHSRSRSDSTTNSHLSPESPTHSRGRRRKCGESSRSRSRRSSPYPSPNSSDGLSPSTVGSEHAISDAEPPDICLRRRGSSRRRNVMKAATDVGTELPLESQNSYSNYGSSSSSSVLVMDMSSYQFGPASSTSTTTPRKVGSDKINDAARKRRRTEPKFQCHLCSQKLTTKHNLKNHLNSHFGIKNNACKVCSRSFTTTSDLKRHLEHCHNIQ
ncbi:hypothetical protein AX17_006438 [Amanita inopinata Kibby_2008]|nr:hypothetical protein AX17_006438 [Amanita inopinata Kibby_2008]